MTFIVLPFSRYPHKAKTLRLLRGAAEIKLIGRYLVLNEEKSNKFWLIPNGKILPWEFGRIEMDDPCDVCDVERFVRGRYWPVIDALLIAQLMRDQGHLERAKPFAELAAVAMRRIAA